MGNGLFSTCALNKLVLSADTLSFGGATSPSFLGSEGLSTTASFFPVGHRSGHGTQAGPTVVLHPLDPLTYPDVGIRPKQGP